MKRQVAIGAACVAVAMLGVAWSATAADAVTEVSVKIAPQTLLVNADQGGEVTVHVGIAYSTVDTSTVALDGLAAAHTKADDCGRLVAYFDEVAVKAMVSGSSATLTLTGQTLAGAAFAGSDTVRVTNCQGRR